MIKFPAEKLKEMLIKDGLVKAEDFEQLIKEALRKKQDITDLLISRNVITQEYLYNFIAQSLGVERVNLRTQSINETTLHLINEDLARRLRVIVFKKDPETGQLSVAMEDPTDLEAVDFLERRLQAKIKVFLATEEDLNSAFALYERKIAEDFRKVIEDAVQKSLSSQALGEETAAAVDVPIVAILDNIISYAISLRASDIHMESLENAFLVRYRVDGILHEILRIPKEIQAAIIARIKLLGGLRIDEHSKPQDGRFRYNVGGQVADVRVATIPTYYGEKAEMRLLLATQKPLSFEELGMMGDTIEMLRENIKKTYGIVLVCGPTGSGKTTTLYSILSILNTPEVNIVTVEDPIEYDMRYVNQTQVNPAAGITFATGLRALLRQDPNIVMVGEIRDEETGGISVQAALTGHLVLSSLHTNDAPTAIPRLMDMKIQPFLIAAVLNAVLAQRLVRRIHLDCRKSYEIDEVTREAIKKQYRELGIDPTEKPIAKVLYKGMGCDSCGHTGYFGRLGIFEIISITESIRKLIIDPKFSLDAIKQEARREGMITMFEDGIRKAELGLTTIEEVLRVIRE